MNQIKIGKFIAECRKQKNLTQMQLAEKLGITDRAVSKWETGRAMPDSSIMLSLCGILNVTVNDLLSGEVISMENYNKESERNLLEAVKQKEGVEFFGSIPSFYIYVFLNDSYSVSSDIRFTPSDICFASFGGEAEQYHYTA